MQTDPIGYKDDMDLYSYVGDDPVNKTDPTGLECVTPNTTTCVKPPDSQESKPQDNKPSDKPDSKPSDKVEEVVVTGKKGESSNYSFNRLDGYLENFNQCRGVCLKSNYGSMYDTALNYSPFSLVDMVTNEAQDLFDEGATNAANRHAWSAERKTFETGKRELKKLSVLRKFNAGMAVVGAGAGGFVAGANMYCGVSCL